MVKCGYIFAVASPPHSNDALVTSCGNELLVPVASTLIKLAIHKHNFEVFDLVNVYLTGFGVKSPDTRHFVT